MAKPKKKKALTYRDAGVDIDRGDAFIDRIAPMAKATVQPGVMGGLGGFGSLFALPRGYKEPVLVAGTDGVGTKLKLAFDLKKHDTIGIDLVAMCVNDIVVQGARPLFFLDYFSTSRLEPARAAQVVKGIAAGCKQAGCALVGGETAEMPGFYQPGEYDLAGFAVGVVEKKKMLPARGMKAGDVIIGLSSSGVHSNGYSLVRKILSARKISLSRTLPGSKQSVGKALLAPTTIYVPVALDLLRKVPIKGFAHITGGGLPGNLPRVVPPSLRPVLDGQSWELPAVFKFLQDEGGVATTEMLRTFNCGIGFCAIVPEKAAAKALTVIASHRIQARVIGVMEKRAARQPDFEIVW